MAFYSYLGVWRGCLGRLSVRLLPMPDNLLRAYIWDSLAFTASLSVLKHAVGAVKAWSRLPTDPAITGALRPRWLVFNPAVAS